MGDRTAVDTVKLAAAAAAARRQAQELGGAAGASGPVLGRLAADLSGARSAPEVEAARRAAVGALADLGRALDLLAALLAAAAARYADAERATTPAGPAAGPATAGQAAGATGRRPL